MNILKKYWWCFLLAPIIIAVILNFILLIPAFAPIVGDNSDWLQFWGSLIGASASFTMIFFTAKTLEQNKQQLEEMKRQWDEVHRPRLYGRISTYQRAFFLEIYNAGNEDANCVDVKVNSDFYNNVPSAFRYIYDNMTQTPFYVKAGKSVNFYIGTCEEINKSWENLDFNIEISGKYNNKFDLYILLPVTHFVNKVHMVVRTPIEKALEDISEGLVRPHLISQPKAIQLYIQSISENLDKLTKRYCNDGTEQTK